MVEVRLSQFSSVHSRLKGRKKAIETSINKIELEGLLAALAFCTLKEWPACCLEPFNS